MEPIFAGGKTVAHRFREPVEFALQTGGLRGREHGIKKS
jgi:hypothetical protein